MNLLAHLKNISCFALVGLIAFSFSNKASAEKTPVEEASRGVSVKVRAIEASDKTDNESVSAASIESVEPRLADVSAKLSQLGFRKYKIISEHDITLAVMEKENVSLGGSHTLALRPLYITGSRVGMWIHWTDKDAVILDTRMHFTCADKVFTGAESDPSGEKAVILAMTAKPAE